MALGTGRPPGAGRRASSVPARPGDGAAAARRKRVTVATLPPSILRRYPPGAVPRPAADHRRRRGLPPRTSFARWAPGRRLINAYGPERRRTVLRDLGGDKPADGTGTADRAGRWPRDTGFTSRMPALAAGARRRAGRACCWPGRGLALGLPLDQPGADRGALRAQPFVEGGRRLPHRRPGCAGRADGQIEFLGRLDQPGEAARATGSSPTRCRRCSASTPPVADGRRHPPLRRQGPGAGGPTSCRSRPARSCPSSRSANTCGARLPAYMLPRLHHHARWRAMPLTGLPARSDRQGAGAGSRPAGRRRRPGKTAAAGPPAEEGPLAPRSGSECWGWTPSGVPRTTSSTLAGGLGCRPSRWCRLAAESGLGADARDALSRHQTIAELFRGAGRRQRRGRPPHLGRPGPAPLPAAVTTGGGGRPRKAAEPGAIIESLGRVPAAEGA